MLMPGVSGDDGYRSGDSDVMAGIVEPNLVAVNADDDGGKSEKFDNGGSIM